MPTLPSTLLLNTLGQRNATAIATNATNATSNALQVVCAWPVSGQYGPGSRILYYVLIAACVFARKAEWLRNACLAAALLFPAVAAIHGIVLATVRVNDAVDMDVYGAFQLCSIGILAAPVTVRLSRTYFYDPGRNTIFSWTGLILAGLLSLTVSFFQIKTFDCTHDDSGNLISSDESIFPYGTTCGLTCSPEKGPSSPMRGGSANNIYVIPAPGKLTFGAATLLAAACCVPAILSLMSMWNKILEINWKSRFGDRDEDARGDGVIEGTNGATVEKMSKVNNLVRLFLSAVEIPVFSAAVLAILIVGERNFFSTQVRYQTEPLANIGQWAPIVGAGLAVLGSLYLLLAADLEAVENEAKSNVSLHHPNSSVHSVVPPSPMDLRRSFSDIGIRAMSEVAPTTSRPADAGNRRKVAKALTAVSNHLGTAAHKQFDDSEFKHGKALDFPEIPGEEHRNRALRQIREQYNPSRDSDGNVTPGLRENASRAGSFAGSITSRMSMEEILTPPGDFSHQAPQSSFPSSSTARTARAGTFSPERASFELQTPPLPTSIDSNGGRPRQWRDTLEVPALVYHSSTRNSQFAAPINSSVATAEGQISPTIVVFSDPDTSSSHTPFHNVQPIPPSARPLSKSPISAPSPT